MIIADQAACLSPADGHRWTPNCARILPCWIGLGDKKVEAEAGLVAFRLDHDAVMARASAAIECDRAVTLRPAPAWHAYATALLTLRRRRYGPSSAAGGGRRRRGRLDRRRRWMRGAKAR